MDLSAKSVAQLPADARAALEFLVGQPLDGQQRVFIVLADSDAPSFRARRDEARLRLQETLREFHNAVQASGMTADEVERTIEEACHDVRYGSK